MTAQNPFVDPVLDADNTAQRRLTPECSTLTVGRDASLTLGTDSLIVLGMNETMEL